MPTTSILRVLPVLCTTLAWIAPAPAADAQDVLRGSGQQATEMRDVAGVRSVVLDAPGLLIIRQGTSEALQVQGDTELVRLLTTRVDDGTLVIRLDIPGRAVPQTPLQYHLTVETLENLRLAAGGHVEVLGDLSAQRLSLSLAGSGEAFVPGLRAQALRLSIAGSGSARIGGEVDEQTISILGSGGVNARELESRRAVVRLAGSGSAVVRVQNHLEMSIPGGGDVRYFGNPAVVLRNEAEVGGRVYRVGEAG